MFIRYDGTFWREETLTLDMIQDFDSVNRTPNDGDVLHWDTELHMGSEYSLNTSTSERVTGWTRHHLHQR